MLLFLYGKDTYRSRQKLHEMVAKFKSERDPGGYNVHWFNFVQATPAGKVMEELLAVPFLASRKMIVLESLLSSTAALPLMKQIGERFGGPGFPESQVIVIWEGVDAVKGKDAKVFFDRLKKEKYAYEFQPLDPKQLGAWIGAKFATVGRSITPAAVATLAGDSGGDLWLLDNVIQTLIAYATEPPQTIDVAEVRLFLEKKADDNIFRLVDAVVAGRAAEAYALLSDQYRLGNEPLYIFAMLVRQFRILLELRDWFERADLPPSAAIATKLKLHPFVVTKSLPIAKRFTLTKLEAIYGELLRFDEQVKTGQADAHELLEIFIGRQAILAATA